MTTEPVRLGGNCSAWAVITSPYYSQASFETRDNEYEKRQTRQLESPLPGMIPIKEAILKYHVKYQTVMYGVKVGHIQSVQAERRRWIMVADLLVWKGLGPNTKAKIKRDHEAIKA